MMFKVLLIFFFSGFAALIYELLWFRQLGFIFGNTVYAATTVLTAYMFGLAVGAYLFGRIAHRVAKPLRLFGILEVLIGVWALGMPFMLNGVRLAYRWAYLYIGDVPAVLTLIRFVLAVLVMLTPTLLMGATLPVLAQALTRKDRKFATRLSFLYGLNTMGAVSGLVLAAFLFLPRLGLVYSNLLAAGCDILVGLIAIYLSRSFHYASEPEPRRVHPQRTPVSRRVLLAAGTSGFIALALEVIWFRALILIFGSTTYSFAVMLSVFLFGIAAGSLLFGWVADRLASRATLLGLCFLGVGVWTLLTLYTFTTKPIWLLHYLVRRDFEWTGLIHAKVLLTLFFLLVPTLLFGFIFTLAAKMVREDSDTSGYTVGRVYTWNTVGAVLGALTGGFVLLPRLGIQTSLTLLGTLALFIAIAVTAGAGQERRRVFLMAGLASVPLAMILFYPPYWNVRVLASGAYFSPWNFVSGSQVVFWEKLETENVAVYVEGVTSTVSITETVDENLYFSIDGKVEADTSERGMVVQRLIGHLPMLFHPDPTRVMNLGLGAGVTFGALGCYPVEHLEAVEIEPQVLKAAAAWSLFNHNIVEHPQAIFTINDGRNHLFCTTNLYDVITSDPFEPVVGGAASLFTVEHFRQAKARLAPHGLMCQWLPMYELSQEDYFTIMRSFAHVFPNSAIFFTGTDSLMIGLQEGDRFDLANVAAKFEIPAVRESLAEVGFDGPEAIMAMFVARMDEFPRMSIEGRLNTDRHPFIEFSAPKSALRYTPDSNQRVLLEAMTPVPEEWLTDFTEEQKDVVRKNHDALELVLRANIERADGRGGESFQLLLQAARMAPESPVIRNELVAALLVSANQMRSAGHLQQAALQYQMALQHDPTAFGALFHLFHLYMMAGQEEEGMRLLDFAQNVRPDSPTFTLLRGKVAMVNEQWDEALEHTRTAFLRAPWRLDVAEQYAELNRRVGRDDVADRIEADVRANDPRRRIRSRFW